jgi:hypothetical protein
MKIRVGDVKEMGVEVYQYQLYSYEVLTQFLLMKHFHVHSLV